MALEGYPPSAGWGGFSNARFWIFELTLHVPVLKLAFSTPKYAFQRPNVESEFEKKSQTRVFEFFELALHVPALKRVFRGRKCESGSKTTPNAVKIFGGGTRPGAETHVFD